MDNLVYPKVDRLMISQSKQMELLKQREFNTEVTATTARVTKDPATSPRVTPVHCNIAQSTPVHCNIVQVPQDTATSPRVPYYNSTLVDC